MTFTELYQKYFSFIWSAFEYDMEVFAQGWVYYWALVPAIAYLCFFVTKWAIITAPLWLPVRLVMKSLPTINLKISKRK